MIVSSRTPEGLPNQCPVCLASVVMEPSNLDLDATREKLRMLQERYEASLKETHGNPQVREISLSSLRRLIKQLTEEIARYESRLSKS